MTPTARKRLKIAAWPLGVVAVAAIAVVACEVAGWPFLKNPAQQQLTQRLARPVEFGDEFRLKLFGAIRLDTSALRIGPPEGAEPGSPLAGDLVNARRAHLELPYATVRQLMDKDNEMPPHITSLRFGEVDAALKRLADGRANWTFATKPRDPAQKPVEMPTLDELVVERGRIVLDDAVIKTALEAKVSTDEGAQVVEGRRQAGLVVEGKGRHENRPFDFRVTSSGVLPLIARGAQTKVPITIRLAAGDAKFSFDGTSTDIISFHALDGNAALSGPSLAKVGDALGMTLPTTEPFTLKGRLGKSGRKWSLQQADLDVGDSHLGGNFSYDQSPKVPMLSGELTGSRLVLADLLPAFGAARPGTGNPKPPAGEMLPHRELDIPSLRMMNANVKVKLQRADLGTLFRQPLSPLQGDLTLDGGVLRLSNLLARAAGGEVKGKFSVDGTQKNALWAADLRWAGIELDSILRPRNKQSQAPKPSGENPAYVTGRIGGHLDLQARGRSTAQMVASTDGTVQAWVRDGSLSHLVVEAAGIDVAQALGVLIRGDKQLPMHCAVVRANAKNGTLTPEVAMVDTPDTTIFVTGTVSLAQETLALKLTARPKDVSPLALRSPVRVEGKFAQPKIALDKEKIGGRVLAAVALATVHPLAALIPLFDPGDKEHAGGCQRALQHLRDADGPPTARDAKAPRATDKNLPRDPEPRTARPREARPEPTGG